MALAPSAMEPHPHPFHQKCPWPSPARCFEPSQARAERVNVGEFPVVEQIERNRLLNPQKLTAARTALQPRQSCLRSSLHLTITLVPPQTLRKTQLK